MRNLVVLFSLAYLLSGFITTGAQEYANTLENIPANYKKRSPVYDYSEKQLNHIDTIPDFNQKANKLKITGTIYKSDGKTPAGDVILYVCQPDENGDYQMKKDVHRKRYVHHRGWIKTDKNGQYTFYTFIPGKYLYSKELKQIHRVIKEPGKPEYEIKSFFFNDDPLLPELTLACRAKAVGSMLRLEKEGTMYVATKDIKLNKDILLVQ